MTSTTHNCIELSDLIGIKLECRRCHFIAVSPLENTIRIIQTCPNCHETWMPDISEGKSIKEHIEAFRVDLSVLKQVLQGTDKFMFSLEISVPVASAKD